MLDMKFSESVKSRLSVKMHFPKYNVQQLLEILEEYAKISLKENSYTREDLFKIASHVGNFTGNARMAKRILYFVAEKSGERLDMSKLPESISEEEKLMWEKEVERLSLELRLTLLAVIRSNKKFEAERERLSLSRDLTRYAMPPSVQPTVKNIYSSYLEVCSEYGFNPKSEMTVRNSIDELDKQMLVRREIKGFGRAKGVTSVIFLRGFADVLEPIIRKSIEKIIS
jgi:Cdc6-like AAA superfamily ATPase